MSDANRQPDESRGPSGPRPSETALTAAQGFDPASVWMSAPIAAGPSVGDVIGPYRLTRLIGEGGFGMVYEAEQSTPVRRRVALKVLKLGMDTREVVARFDAERQALAVMDHPSVARVFDAGATPTGRPYFVMEYVDGVSITTYCDRARLTARQRLELFEQVCRAVQHAHQKGIIHRDLKPSNILVAEHSGRATPKVIDFGIAKATRPGVRTATYVTEAGQFIGTPEYMAPEQAGMADVDIDTRADVYALGVILYELLVGALPFRARDMRALPVSEIQRMVVEDEPPRPSTRLSSMGRDADKVAMLRSTTPAGLARQLRGELEWIPLRAMEKPRDRRYASVSEFAQDVENYLAGRPLLAGPPTTTYRLRKFISRHRVGVAMGGVVLLGAAIGVGLLMVGLARAQQAEVQERIAKDAAIRARDTAATEAATSKAVNDFLNTMLASVSPGVGGKDMTVREVLDQSAAQAAEQLKSQPQVEGRIRDTIGTSYLALGEYKIALTQFERAHALANQYSGPDAVDTLAALNNIATAKQYSGDIAGAEQLFVPTLARMEKALGPTHKQTLSTANNLAMLWIGQGKYAEAEPLLRKTLEAQTRTLGERDPTTLDAMNNLATLLEFLDRYAEAMVLAKRALNLRREVQGSEHPGTLIALNNYALLLNKTGKSDEAEPLYRETYELSIKVLGEEHNDTLTSLSNLAGLIRDKGRAEEAEPMFRRVLAARLKTLGAEHSDTIECYKNIGLCLMDLKRVDEAIENFTTGLALAEKTLGDEASDTMMARYNLATAYNAKERFADALPLIEKASSAAEKLLPEQHWRRGVIASEHGAALTGVGRAADAVPVLTEATRILDEAVGPAHKHATLARTRLEKAKGNAR
ncbi:MAG: serine/threonine-protein kinase, partial [Planctomycetota bacterium]|nr:serine/threonine-protein kinase [Planctomycetota bacterium]